MIYMLSVYIFIMILSLWALFCNRRTFKSRKKLFDWLEVLSSNNSDLKNIGEQGAIMVALCTVEYTKHL